MLRFGFHLTSPNYPSPDPRNTPAHLAALERWKQTFPQAIEDPREDREVFFEHVDQFFALQSVLPNIEIFFGEMPEQDSELALFGAYNNRYRGNDDVVGYAWPDAPHTNNSAQWFEEPAILAFANRDIRLADIPGEGHRYIERTEPNALHQILADLSQARDRDLIIKVVARQKYMAPQRVVVPRGATAGQIDRMLFETFDFTLVHFEGTEGAFLVSDFVPMRREYRIVMIDQRPVAGAGCIDEFDPYFAVTNDGFDPQMLEHRGIHADGREDVVAQQPETLAAYRRVAESIGEALRASNSPMRHFTLDLCLDDEDRVTVVECNPLHNFGRYAMPFEPIAEASANYLGAGASAPSN